MKNLISELTNQEIIDKVKLAKERVAKEIYANQNCLVGRLLETDYDCEFQIEGGAVDFDNAFDHQEQVLEFLRTQELIDEGIEFSRELYEQHKVEIDEFLENETDSLSQNQEWYEPWLCSEWFLRQIEGKGGLIGNYADCEQWWLRQTTWQSFWLDGIIQDIVIELAANFLGFDANALETEIKNRKLNNGSEYLSGFVCNIEYIKTN